MTHFSDPNSPPDKPLAPGTSHEQRRVLGVLIVTVIVTVVGWGAWHFTHEVAAADSRDVPIPITR